MTPPPPPRDAQTGEEVLELALLIRENARLKAEVRRRDLALQSLTPGGSEYVNDPERCVAFARDVRSSKHDLICRLIRQMRAAGITPVLAPPSHPGAPSHG